MGKEKKMDKSSERIDELLSVLGEVWKEYPNYRLGQIISLAAARSPRPLVDIFYIVDSDLRDGLIQFRESVPKGVSR